MGIEHEAAINRHNVYLPNLAEVHYWINENTNGYCRKVDVTRLDDEIKTLFYFDNIEDAMAFKLRWS